MLVALLTFEEAMELNMIFEGLLIAPNMTYLRSL